MANTFVLYAPVEEMGEFRSGGPIMIKTGQLSSSYLAFASETLAEAFRTRSKVGLNARIVDSRRLGPEFPMPAGSRTALRFPDQQAVEAYFSSPDTFPYDQHLVTLEPGHAA